MTQLGAGFAIPIECEGKYDNGLDLRIEQGYDEIGKEA